VSRPKGPLNECRDHHQLSQFVEDVRHFKDCRRAPRSPQSMGFSTKAAPRLLRSQRWERPGACTWRREGKARRQREDDRSGRLTVVGGRGGRDGLLIGRDGGSGGARTGSESAGNEVDEDSRILAARARFRRPFQDGHSCSTARTGARDPLSRFLDSPETITGGFDRLGRSRATRSTPRTTSRDFRSTIPDKANHCPTRRPLDGVYSASD